MKPTDKGLFYNAQSFISESYKSNLIYIHVYRVFHIPSSYEIFHDDLEVLKAKFMKNGFSSILFELTVGNFLDKLYTPKELVTTVKSMRVTMVLPYLGPYPYLLNAVLPNSTASFILLWTLRSYTREDVQLVACSDTRTDFPRNVTVMSYIKHYVKHVGPVRPMWV